MNRIETCQTMVDINTFIYYTGFTRDNIQDFLVLGIVPFELVAGEIRVPIDVFKFYVGKQAYYSKLLDRSTFSVTASQKETIKDCLGMMGLMLFFLALTVIVKMIGEMK